jgi:hypothetical protein
VYAVDPAFTLPEPPSHSPFPNVHLIQGDGAAHLPALLIARQPSFVFIDANHYTEAVKRDIRALTSVAPTVVQHVLFHDSFNPACRTGIREACWQTDRHTWSVHLDFVPGVFHGREMWGGFALALRSPTRRKSHQPCDIRADQQDVFDAIYPHSAHYPG